MASVIDQRGDVGCHLEARVASRHIVRHDQINLLGLELGSGPRQYIVGFGCESDQQWV